MPGGARYRVAGPQPPDGAPRGDHQENRPSRPQIGWGGFLFPQTVDRMAGGYYAGRTDQAKGTTMTNLTRSTCCNESISRPGHSGPWFCDNCGGEAFRPKAAAQATDTTWVHVHDDEPCDLFTVETAGDLDRGICGHGQQVTEVYTEAPQEPVDPDTVYLTRAARRVLSFWNAADPADPNLGVRALAALWVWEELTGLEPEDALAYAQRLTANLTTTHGEVTAHVAPF